MEGYFLLTPLVFNLLSNIYERDLWYFVRFLTQNTYLQKHDQNKNKSDHNFHS